MASKDGVDVDREVQGQLLHGYDLAGTQKVQQTGFEPAS
jgi:hypothetical protein